MKLLLALVCIVTAWQQLARAADLHPTKLKSISEIRSEAEAGNPFAQNELAVRFETGDGLPQSDVEAVKWFRKAAEQGHAPAQASLGTKLAKGEGLPENEAEALMWFQKAANQGEARAQYGLGVAYQRGRTVEENANVAADWYRKAAAQGHDRAQFNLGFMYFEGKGVERDYAQALHWYRKAADKGLARAQFNLGSIYSNGHGVPKDPVLAVGWYRKAANQGDGLAQSALGLAYAMGQGVPKDEVEAYKWWLLASAQGDESAKRNSPQLERNLPPAQRAEGQRLAREFRPRQAADPGERQAHQISDRNQPQSSGTGFFITADGYFVTNQHVAGEGATVRVLTAAGTIPAKVAKVDKANDLALLKVDGTFTALPVIASRGARLGATVATVGFPNIGLQGFAPKLAKGEIASLAGAQDDARHFQISAPIQPGNSGGALVDERGNVIGVVVAKLSQQAALATSGTLAENVNYAVKSSYLLSFLESVPEVAAQLKEPNTKARPFEDVVKDVEQATVLVLVF